MTGQHGGSDAVACSKYCETDPECKWFWHYHSGASNGRCCPKRDISGGWKTVAGGQMYRLCRPDDNPPNNLCPGVEGFTNMNTTTLFEDFELLLPLLLLIVLILCHK